MKPKELRQVRMQMMKNCQKIKDMFQQTIFIKGVTLLAKKCRVYIILKHLYKIKKKRQCIHMDQSSCQVWQFFYFTIGKKWYNWKV